jgi:hypothetical protein
MALIIFYKKKIITMVKIKEISKTSRITTNNKIVKI